MNWSKTILGIVLVLAVSVGWIAHRDLNQLQAIAFLPGHLSKAHSFLGDKCTSCHIPNQGISVASCIACHANNTNLIKRQSTSFHASIQSCKECHREHQGGLKPPLGMDHLTLAKIAAETHEPKYNKIQNQLLRQYYKKRHAQEISSEVVSINNRELPLISTLSCTTCHATRDKHQGLFGTSCLSCHTTQTWRIAEYRHPSPNSRNCSQCHQAPPSHHMGHFEMVSQRVAGQRHARVNQCFLCHQTTSWNDIKGVGWYKHH
ncbi:MAG: hypothetical protein A4S09_15240 [Proteobacteria bacterium SG_bin7]|nr:MAG: hypothetical protein A4S09_15240 [Proteobacteria bacterium SG_bin7]